MFSNWVNLAGGAASTKTTNVIRSLVGKVEGITPEHDATSLRNGSIDDMAFNASVNTIDMTYRGGWDWTSDCKMWKYPTQTLFIKNGGMALSGFRDSRGGCVAPTCDSFITMENRVTVGRIVKRLFGNTGYAEFDDDGNLASFRFVLFASLLNYFEKMISELGLTHILFSRVFAVTNMFDVTYGTLKGWAESVCTAWILANKLNTEGKLSDADQAYMGMAALLEDYQKHKTSDMENKVLIKQLGTKVDALAEMLGTLLTMRAGVADGSVSSRAGHGNCFVYCCVCLYYYYHNFA